jgi:hypothetical protein
MLIKFNKSVAKAKERVKEQHVARYNLGIDSEVEGLIHQNAKVSTTTKLIFNSGASTHMTLNTVLL